ncbi:DNA primase large subunit PriL [Halonotius terrestris]|uniref:DNA primase large subunit PriL n=1 Tax=Halonotius terrestris TaxID=2487750 RepID=UPI002AA29E22|nr:DNA primase large subunit PriL [Halonotius terrestris]
MAITPRDARYPFLAAARAAVTEAGVDLAELVATDEPAVDRGRERVERALLAGRVDSETPDQWRVEDELLSYPIARILVSLLDSPAAVEKYAAAEAKTAIERLQDDLENAGDELRSTPSAGIDRETLITELGLEGSIRPEREGATTTGDATAGDEPAWFHVGVGTYLELASGARGDGWRLVNRELSDGAVRVEREELFRLLRTAIRRRVAEGLPFDGLNEDEGIAAELEAELTDLRRLLSERTRVGEIDFVARELFPPCIENLLQKAEDGIELEGFEQFTLMAFLTGIGMDADEIVAFCAASSLEPEGIRYQTEYLKADRGTQYPPPSCETLSAYGICHNEDDHWKVAGHPLEYYQQQLETADDVVDWREQAADD